MLTLVLTLLLGIQGIPAANQTGTITGVLKDSSGKPAAGVRVGAVAVPDSTLDVASASAMVSLAQTDATGRYRLENIPPGRYYVAAGRLDFPTYYPGTQAIGRGTVVPITSSATVNGIDFTLQDLSSGAPSVAAASTSLSFSLPVQVVVEGGGKLPVFSPSGFLFIGLTNIATGVRTNVPVNASTFPLPSQTVEYRVGIDNVPAGYRVKSMMAGTMDVAADGLKLSSMTFKPSTQTATTTQMIATASLSITLATTAQTAVAAGVRVTGRTKSTERRSVYISGQPGILYSDGSFEFRGVPAGQHTIATVENPESRSQLGAVVVVGNRDIEDLELEPVSVLPINIRSAVKRNAGSQAAGTALHLASLRVALVDEATRQPAGPGTVYVLGPLGTSFDLPSEGKFEFPHLLPGKYSFEIQVFRHASITRTIDVEDQDIALELTVAGTD